MSGALYFTSIFLPDTHFLSACENTLNISYIKTPLAISSLSSFFFF